MIAIDGEVNPKEMLLWVIITERCGFPEMNLMEAGAKLRQYLQNIKLLVFNAKLLYELNNRYYDNYHTSPLSEKDSGFSFTFDVIRVYNNVNKLKQ